MSAPPPTVARERNWGRWGDDAQLGAANHLSPETVRAAAGLVRSGRVFSLALPIRDRSTPVLPGRPSPQHFMRLDGGDYAAGFTRKGGFQSVDDVIMMPTHSN